MSPRRIEVSHDEAELIERSTRQEQAEQARQVQQRADDWERQRELARTLARIPGRYRLRGSAAYEPDHPPEFSGYVQSFSCGCDKPEHGHNPFASIKEPTELVFIDPAEEAAKLAERVNRARTQTPPVAAPPPGGRGGGRTNTTRRTMRR